jgi:LysM repeat protein
VLVAVNPGETLEILAARYKTTPDLLSAANCLVSPSLLPGYGIYVPPVPTNTPIPCGAPFGWVQYTVQAGDNLYRIALRYGVTVEAISRANGIINPWYIRVGQVLIITSCTTPPPPPIGVTYVVRPGDTLRARSECLAKRESGADPRRGVVEYRYSLVNQRDEIAWECVSVNLVERRPRPG